VDQARDRRHRGARLCRNRIGTEPQRAPPDPKQCCCQSNTAAVQHAAAKFDTGPVCVWHTVTQPVEHAFPQCFTRPVSVSVSFLTALQRKQAALRFV
jgi:hypothetical protein